MVWGDRFIITPSEFLYEKWTFYPALVISRILYNSMRVPSKEILVIMSAAKILQLNSSLIVSYNYSQMTFM